MINRKIEMERKALQEAVDMEENMRRQLAERLEKRQMKLNKEK